MNIDLPPSGLANVKKVVARKSTKVVIMAALILECADGSLSRRRISNNNDIVMEAALHMLKLAIICVWKPFLSVGLS